MIDDSGFCFLNDGTPTHSSYSYATVEALDVAVVSPNVFPGCNWKTKQHFIHKSEPLQNLLEEKKHLLGASGVPIEPSIRTQLQKLNAVIKRTYAQKKRDNWNKLCCTLDPGSS
ncbi:hypothetical protein TNCV_195521 [Trichonephila clavipes]|uniref:Uncharacterized protein n=1 Tax=Trichonephila clavipes TaxID=2585209 RepID=A0A8X6WJJ8_TRICX|nr:hypothetical protein TNCV_195521 [Trichonephila clavipes]